MIDNFQRLHVLLEEALELDPVAAVQLVERTCANDQALRIQLLALLAIDRSSDLLLDREIPVPSDIFSVTGEYGSPHGLLRANDSVGDFVVERVIGRGGMGEVYLAARQLGGAEQRVAVKVVKTGLDSTEIRRRALIERAALSRLEHPGIARLIDAGVTHQGRPYIAMEYVDGADIATWSERNSLDLQQRLQLLLCVADAVEYAHQRLVVHRDLKPSNIVVRDDGRTALLDFGIAKLVDELDPALSTQQLDTGRALTPEYAAPEQVSGAPITVATDVYGLGAVLYCLLTGRPPVLPSSRSLRDIEHAVLEQIPEAPSRLKPAVAARLVGISSIDKLIEKVLSVFSSSQASELDTVVLKALSKQPEQRYRTVATFADDIRRLLSGHPVQARRPSMGYRFARFVGRNKSACTLGAIAVVSTLASAALITRSANIASQQAVRASAIKDFVVGVFSATDPEFAAVRPISVRELLERSARDIGDGLAADGGVQSELMLTLATMLEQHGSFAHAQTLAQKAIENLRSHGAPGNDIAKAQIQLAIVMQWQGRYADSKTALDQAQALVANESAPDRALSMRIQNRLALAELNQGALENAKQRARDAYSLASAAEPRSPQELAMSLTTLGRAAQLADNNAEAETFLRQALLLRQQAFGSEHVSVAETLMNLGVLAESSGQLAQSEQCYREALAIRRKTLDADHPLTAISTNNLGALLVTMGRYDEAGAMLQESLRAKQATYGQSSPQLAVSWHNLSKLALARHDLGLALQLSTRALDAGKEALARPHPNVAAMLLVQAEIRLLQQNTHEASELAGEAVQSLASRFGPRHPRVLEAQLVLGRSLREGEEAKRGRVLIEHIYQQRLERFGHEDWRTAEAELRFAQSLPAPCSEAQAHHVASAEAVLTAAFGATHVLVGEARALQVACAR
ncbi:MAG: serine/threonine protein kinase [Rhodanobacteraceae bacterium]|nr:serine/threonine protein kinase [Rhodanobacteraceae bacterium]